MTVAIVSLCVNASPDQTLFFSNLYGRTPRGARDVKKSDFFLQMKVLSSCPFGSQNIKNRVFRVELFFIYLIQQLKLIVVVQAVLTPKVPFESKNLKLSHFSTENLIYICFSHESIKKSDFFTNESVEFLPFWLTKHKEQGFVGLSYFPSVFFCDI